MRDWTGSIQRPSRVFGGDLEPAAHVPALLLLLLSWLPRVHLSGCADPPAQALDHQTAAFRTLSELLKRLGSEGRRPLLARDVVSGHRVARQRLEGRERARSLGARAEGDHVSVAVLLGGGERECTRVAAVAVCASQTLRARNGPMLACRLRHLSHPRDSRDRGKCQPPNTLYPRPSSARILGNGLLLHLLRGDDTLILWFRAGSFQESRQAIDARRGPTPGSTRRFCPTDGDIAGKPLRDLVQARQALSALSAGAALVGGIWRIRSVAFPGQAMHLHAHPHVAG